MESGEDSKSRLPSGGLLLAFSVIGTFISFIFKLCSCILMRSDIGLSPKNKIRPIIFLKQTAKRLNDFVYLKFIRA